MNKEELSTIGSQMIQRLEANKLQTIQNQLTQRLEACNLVDRISFDETAFEELYKLSNGDLIQADLYAGTAILNALQSKKTSITKEDVKAANIYEALQLMRSGKDIWDDVKYIGQVPGMIPESIQTRRLLHRFDANRNIDAMDAVKGRRLPEYALNNLVQYDEDKTFGPEVKVPFQFNPSNEEVRAVAENVADFVTKCTGEAHEVRDISQGNNAWMTQYLVQPQTQAGQNPLTNFPNYRVANGFDFDSEKAGGVVIVNQERFCKHDKTTLEAYVLSIKSQDYPK